jgi:murein DD-endopeptidase MepM/ murein hydrolase activator NlpD
MTSLNKTSHLVSIVHSVVKPITHFINRAVIHSNRKTRIITFSAIFLSVCAFGAIGVAPIAPDASDLPVRQITEQLQIPSLEDQIQALQERDETFVYEEQVQRGDTLANLLQRLGVDDAQANKFIKSDATARLVMQQKAGKSVRAQTNEQGELQWLQTSIIENVGDAPQLKNVTVTRQNENGAGANGSFNATESKVPLERRVEMKSGKITTSLFAATDAAQIPDAIASQLIDMFSTEVDFSSDLRSGDHFQLLYETFWQNGEMVGAGKVLAGEFTNAGRSYQTVWFNDGKGSGSYYGFDGKSMKKAFLKSPIAFTRISSGFSMRVHPISGKWKQHDGVDFAAPTGTPIHAAADGVIETVGKSGGYGNLVVLKHWSGYSTSYAHMSRFASGLRKGAKVKQGEVIGYVGATGWATAPHLHYELRHNKKPLDPLKVKVGQSQTLAAADVVRFKSVVQDVQHRFTLLRSGDISNQVATR